MANFTTTTFAGTKRRKVWACLDTTATVLLFDKSAVSASDVMKIVSIKGTATFGSAAALAIFSWNADTDDVICRLSGSGMFEFNFPDPLVDPGSTGTNGDIQVILSGITGTVDQLNFMIEVEVKA